MLKLGGVAVIFLACTAAGLFKTFTLGKRVREIEALLDALSFISNEIRYFATPTASIIEKLVSAKGRKGLPVFGLCLTYLDRSKTRDFRCAWDQALDDASPSMALSDADLEALKAFGEGLGFTDAQGQTANCERYIQLFRKRLEEARDDKVKRGRMYSSLGVLTGVLIAAVIL